MPDYWLASSFAKSRISLWLTILVSYWLCHSHTLVCRIYFTMALGILYVSAGNSMEGADFDFVCGLLVAMNVLHVITTMLDIFF